MKHDIGCECLECCLECWRDPDSSRRFREAAEEIDTLRALIDDQLAAMQNTPADDMNYAGFDWKRRAKLARGV
jgi:hypothetical protein